LWKILHYFIMFFVLFIFPPIFVLHSFSRQFSVSHKIVWYSCSNLDPIGSTWPQAAPPIYLFCINAGVSVFDQLVLIWLISNKGYQLDHPDHYFHIRAKSYQVKQDSCHVPDGHNGQQGAQNFGSLVTECERLEQTRAGTSSKIERRIVKLSICK
jgi:hypothetical protein